MVVESALNLRVYLLTNLTPFFLIDFATFYTIILYEFQLKIQYNRPPIFAFEAKKRFLKTYLSEQPKIGPKGEGVTKHF